MDDLISRQALCEYALNQKDKSVTPNDVMRFPSAEPEPHWIPCSEKPDRRDVYRVTVQCEHVDSYPDYEVCYGEYDEENGWFLLGEPVGRIKMVAWMRIDYVEPYQPEEESGGLR